MKHLRQYIRGVLSEDIEFRMLDSPLKYHRQSGIKRIAYCDTTVTEPTKDRWDPYFVAKQEWITRSLHTGKRLKKKRKGDFIPGVSDNCVLGFLDYGHYTDTRKGGTYWYIDYLKVRGDHRGERISSKLVEYFFENVIDQEKDAVTFGKMMRQEVGTLMRRMQAKYPDMDINGRIVY